MDGDLGYRVTSVTIPDRIPQGVQVINTSQSLYPHSEFDRSMSVSTDQFLSDIDVSTIEELVDNYTSLSEYDRDQTNEATVRQQYLNPLLRALGWDTTTDQVRPEQRTITGDADYALALHGREQFFIEAKRFSSDLDGTRRVRGGEQSYVEQAIDYAWHQGCDWAVLTNFHELRLSTSQSRLVRTSACCECDQTPAASRQ